MKDFNATQYFIPMVLIFIGAGLTLDALHVWSFGNLLSSWWPLLVIAFGLLELISAQRSKLFSLLIVVAGLLLLSNRLNWLDINIWQLFWPVILIIIGLSWLMQTGRSPRTTSEHSIDIFTLFSGQERAIDSASFEGGRITNWFGGTKLDLRKATMKDQTTLSIFAAFGGVEIIIPENCRVIMTGTPILGGIEDKTHKPEQPDHTLRIICTVAFGGVEIKN